MKKYFYVLKKNHNTSMNKLYILVIIISYTQAFPNGAPPKTCSHYLPIGAGKSHHGSYPESDNNLKLSLFDSSNVIDMNLILFILLKYHQK